MIFENGEAWRQKEQEPTIYQLKVSIAGAKPPIWRRVLVPSDWTLADLHPVMQALMDWDDDHLHPFEVPGPGQTDVKTRRSRENSQFYGPANAPDGSPLDWLEEDEQEDGESEEDDFGDWLIDRSLKDEAKPVLKQIAPTVKFHPGRSDFELLCSNALKSSIFLLPPRIHPDMLFPGNSHPSLSMLAELLITCKK